MNALTALTVQANEARAEIAETTEALRDLPEDATAERVALLARRAAAIRVLRVRVRV